MGSVNPVFRNDLRGVDAYTRHKRLIRDYVLHYNKGPPPKSSPSTNYKTEYDIIRENHRFVRSDDEDDEDQSWEQRLAKKYYNRLFKEYALCELKYYKEGKIALRWRTEREVIVGKGQFMCASTRCEETNDLKSWEVNFGYIEDGQKKNELVKVRLCPDCSYKLNYKTQKRAAKKEKRRRQQQQEEEEEDETTEPKGKRHKRTRTEEEEEESLSYETAKEEEDERSIWSRPIEQKQEKSKEEEFEDYFADLLQ